MKKEPPTKKKPLTRLAALIPTWAFERFKEKAESNGQTPASRLKLIMEADPEREP